ncbi:C2H2 type zinc finger domain-containing protein [Apiospora saccharicola]
MGKPHASPPVSPNYAYGHSMPSPAHSIPILSPFHAAFSPPSTGNRLRSGSEFSSNNGDRPNISDLPTPASSITDRMSIDNMTNPTDNFVCKFAGCNVAPFQTQYRSVLIANTDTPGRTTCRGMCGYITSIKTKMTPSSAMSFRNVQTDRTVDGDGEAHRDNATLRKEIPAYTDHSFTTSSLEAQASNPPAVHSTHRTVLGFAKYVYCDTDLRGLTFVAFVL